MRKVWGLRTRRRWIEGALNGQRTWRRLLKNWCIFSEATRLSDTSLFSANWKHAYYCFFSRLGQCLGHSSMVLLANWTNNYSFCDLRGAPNFSIYFTRDFRLSLRKLRMNATKSNALFLIGWETTNAKLHATLLANQRKKVIATMTFPRTVLKNWLAHTSSLIEVIRAILKWLWNDMKWVW